MDGINRNTAFKTTIWGVHLRLALVETCSRVVYGSFLTCKNDKLSMNAYIKAVVTLSITEVLHSKKCLTVSSSFIELEIVP